MARTQRPPWWPAFISLERALGTRLEHATRTDEFAALLATLSRIDAGARAAYRRVTADALHRANLPAWSDLRRVADQITALERRMADLTMELERKQVGTGVKPRSNRRRSRSSAR